MPEPTTALPRRPLNENAQKWIDALRSGTYQQGKHKLKTVDGKFCCLGVACDVAIKAGLVIAEERSGGNCAFNGELDTLPREVKQWLGLRDEFGGFLMHPPDVVQVETSLTDLNDSGKTFTEIAEIIESQPRNLFRAQGYLNYSPAAKGGL